MKKVVALLDHSCGEGPQLEWPVAAAMPHGGAAELDIALNGR